MAENALSVMVREGTGKGVARKLRVKGRIPAVLYGRGKPTLSLTLDPHALLRVLQTSEAGMNTLLDLAVDGHADLGGKVVLVKELQRDPVHGSLLHADLYEVDLTQAIQVAVPLHIVGVARGVQFGGGILDHALRELDVECLPRAIPDVIEVDVSELEVGGTVHVRDLVLPEGVKLVSDPDLSVVSVVLPAAEVTVAPEAEVAVEGAVPEGEAAAAPKEGGI